VTGAGARAKAVVAVGAGPSNLSLAALANRFADEIQVTLFEKQPEVTWHAGLLVDGARMQTSGLKDLVTLVDPTNPFGFLSYLKGKRRLYRAVVRGLDRVTRVEFEDYLRWVTTMLPGFHAGDTVERITLEGRRFLVTSSKRRMYCDTIVLGIGRKPFVPSFAVPRIGHHVFHSSRFLSEPRDFTGKRVAVVGGGQSGAEVFRELLRGRCGSAASLCWISRRANLFALEDSPFVNEWFFPQHSMWHEGLSLETRKKALEDQLLASDGINMETLRDIYDLLYSAEIGRREMRPQCDIQVNVAAEGMDPGSPEEQLLLRNRLTGRTTRVVADFVVLCTGYQAACPPFLESFRPLLRFVDCGGGEELAIRGDFSVDWDGPPECKIYVQNGARTQYGIADTNLSLISWRSAKILNSILGREALDCAQETGTLCWGADSSHEEE
jgi:lysine N6-hydroxylase